MSSDLALYLATVAGSVALLVFTLCGGIRWLGRMIGRALRPLAFLQPAANWLLGAALSVLGVLSCIAGIIIIVGLGERAATKIPAKYHDWQREQWVEECAKYSELPDCKRRYSELQVGK